VGQVDQWPVDRPANLSAGGIVIKFLIARLISADRARSNALQASRIVSNERREREEIDAYLERLGAPRSGAA
jgi:hypothetical protein